MVGNFAHSAALNAMFPGDLLEGGEKAMHIVTKHFSTSNAWAAGSLPAPGCAHISYLILRPLWIEANVSMGTSLKKESCDSFVCWHQGAAWLPALVIELWRNDMRTWSMLSCACHWFIFFSKSSVLVSLETALYLWWYVQPGRAPFPSGLTRTSSCWKA